MLVVTKNLDEEDRFGEKVCSFLLSHGYKILIYIEALPQITLVLLLTLNYLVN